MTAAQEWGSALRKIMVNQQVPVKELAKVLDMDASRIVAWRNGRTLPMLKSAYAVSEALVAPSLLELCTRLRTMTCVECERIYIDDRRGGSARQWCKPQCKWTGRARVRAEAERGRIARRYDRWMRLAKKRQAAIDAMCRECEPSGVCQTAECPLRGVSPFQLVGAVDVAPAASGVIVRPAGPGRVERNKAKQAEWARKRRAAA